MEDTLMKAALVGGVAGATGLANIVDEQYLSTKLGVGRRDSASSSFMRGALIGGVAAIGLALVRGNTRAMDMFGLGASMTIKDMMDESPTAHQAPMPHVSRELSPPEDYIWAENDGAKYLILDPKYAL